jgi:hypothetical protein
MTDNRNKRWWLWITVAAVANCFLQFWWFSRISLHDIDFDGMAYVGIARHIVDGDFHQSINAFRSPLLSWMIAAITSPGSDFVRVGKMVTMGTVLVCAGLVFAFAYSLWRSLEVAAIAMLWFTFARGLFPLSTQFVTPDYLFAVFVLLYFLVLIRCFRGGSKLDWFMLGAMHALAYLAKAFALPWLAVSTLLAAGFAFGRSRWKEAVVPLVLAACLPLGTALVWGSFLHARYGVFTTGSQLKANLLQNTLEVQFDSRDKGYEVFRDMAPFVDHYGVVDPMPPRSAPWRYQFHLKDLLPAIARAEIKNVPLAVKETLIVLTVGGALAFMLGLIALYRNKKNAPSEFAIVEVVAIDSAILVVTYCMLVFDGRYIFPILPLLIGSAAPFLLWRRQEGNSLALSTAWRRVCAGLWVAGIVFSLVYSASPYRRLRRDYQLSCYRAGQLLKQVPDEAVVSFGIGPYPEHGVGWEAALKSAFFADKKLIAMRPVLPPASQAGAAVRDVQRSGVNAVMVWGAGDDEKFSALVAALRNRCRVLVAEPIHDPTAGQVGLLFLRAQTGDDKTGDDHSSGPNCIAN